MPAPPQTELRVFKVRLTSEPRTPKSGWKGRRQPRGRTPLELVFHSVVPKVVQLVAPGWKNATVSISPVQARETAVRLIPEDRPEDKLEDKLEDKPERENVIRPRRDATPPPGRTNAYQPVGD